MRAVVVPVGVTRETVEGVLRLVTPVDAIIAVTVPGFEDVKKPIVEGLRRSAELLGARFYYVVARPGSADGFVKVYTILRELRPSEVFLVGVTGSRYLLPPLTTVLLWYWRETGCKLYLVHGVEGSEASLEPLQGFYATAMRLSAVQKRLLCLIYGSVKTLSGKELIERYGFTRSVYYVLADMERKGLLRVRRNRIEKTFPGMLVHSLLNASGDEVCRAPAR